MRFLIITGCIFIVNRLLVPVNAYHVPDDVDNSYSNLTRQGKSLFGNFGTTRSSNLDSGCGSGTDSGVCTASSRCKSKGGTTVGLSTNPCSNGEVCCRFTVKCPTNKLEPCNIKLSGTIVSNENPGVLPYYRTYSYIKPKGVCQLRLDFDTLSFSPPDVVGECMNDALRLPSQTICGFNDGGHVNLDFENSNSIEVRISLQNPVSRYAIRSTFIRCNSEMEAPRDCLQYYTGVEGTVRSFGFGSQSNDLDYTVCIRRASGMSKIRWRPCSPVPTVPGAMNTIPFFLTGVLPSVLLRGPACTQDFIQINGLDKYCGDGFEAVTTQAKPFNLYVHFDDIEGSSIVLPNLAANCPMATPPSFLDPTLGGTWTCVESGTTCSCTFMKDPNGRLPDFENTGFCLQYTQLP